MTIANTIFDGNYKIIKKKNTLNLTNSIYQKHVLRRCKIGFRQNKLVNIGLINFSQIRKMFKICMINFFVK